MTAEARRQSLVPLPADSTHAVAGSVLQKSDQQKPKSYLDRLSAYQGGQRETLKGMSRLGQVLSTAEHYAYEAFGQFANDIPGLAPDDQKLPGVLLRGDYQGVEQTSDEYARLLQAKSLRQKIAREMVRDIITDPESRVEISPEQRILLKYGLQIQDAVDDVHLEWHKELVGGPHAKQIKELMENDDFLTLLLGEHGDFLYGLARKEGNSIQFHTYADAYPDQIQRISSFIDGMVEEFTPLAEMGSDEAKAHIAVHRQWQKLLTLDGSAKEQEEEGRRLDVVWMTEADANNPKIHSQVLYPMEAYTSGKSVEWQYDILLKQPEYDAICAMCDNTKWKMHDLFKTDPDFLTLPTLQSSLAILEPTDSTVYLRFIGGTSLGFRSAASNVPNRNEVRLGHDRDDKRLANGSKINFDYVTFEQRSEIAKTLVTNVFGEERATRIFGDTKKLIPLLLGRFVAGHEDAHNILEREDTYKVMGMQNHIDLDEAKADLASMVTCLMPGFLSTGDQESLTKVLFAEELRGLSRWAERNTDRSHLNGNIMLVQLLLDGEILQKTPDGWTFDGSDPQKITRVQHDAKKALLDLAQVYEATNSETARTLARSFQESYILTPSKLLLELIHDAGILSDAEYAREMQEFYPSTRRDTRKKLE